TALFLPLFGLPLGLLACPTFLLLSGLPFRAHDGLPFGKVVAQRHPLAVVGNLVKQPNLIRGEFRFDNCRCEWAFLPAAPANQKRRVAVIRKAHVWVGSVVAHGFVAARNKGGSEFAKVGASALTPALVKYSVREAGSANSGDNG